jgi:hypothetical protein
MLSLITPARAAARSWAMTAATAASIRRALCDDVTRLAADVGRAVVGRAVVEAEAVGLPVEPGVRAGRDALTRWAALLGQLLPRRSDRPSGVNRGG